MWLIAGLGNPGAEYASTRHNIGFLAVDALAGPARFTSKFQSQTAALDIEGEKIILLKPQTYMNDSGRAVSSCMQFYKIKPENIIVLHDELDLALGKIRIKRGGGANGHNGIRDIDELIGPDYWRIRLGIGHPGDKAQVHGHVLSRFSAEERSHVDKLLAALAKHMPQFWLKSPEMLATKLAAELNPQPVKKPATNTHAPDKAGDIKTEGKNNGI